MTRKYFGTDGVRGTVGETPMTPEFVMKLGYAAGKVLSGQSPHPAVLIGKDTRISGYMIESALEAGFSAAGVDVHMCGPVPTPAVAYLTRAIRFRVLAWDINCPSHIPQLFTLEDVEAASAAMLARIADLEAQLAERG
jgi:phosphomannomutase